MFNLLYKVVFGISEGRLKCCFCGKVVMEVMLEDFFFLVYFVEVVYGV